jgi:L-arabinonolactonase
LEEAIPERERPDWWVAVTAAADLGEVPVYDTDNRFLYWIDVTAGELNRSRLAGMPPAGWTETWSLPGTVGSYALIDDGSGAIVALDDGIAVLDFESSEVIRLIEAPYDTAHYRFNDGRVDPVGRFWVGTLRLPGSPAAMGSGHFYRFDDAGLTAAIDGVTVANGLAFSPDGRSMYEADRVNDRILVHDYDVETGTAGPGRIFAKVSPGEIPDGAAVDAHGGYWIAMFGLGEIRRYLPDGRLDRILALPASQPTMCAFAGPDLDILVVTTARYRLDEDQLSAEPLAGSVLATAVGERGLREPRFPRSWLPAGI